MASKEDAKIDLDMVELLGLELGLEVERSSRRKGSSSASVELAERRVLRQGEEDEEGLELELGQEEMEEFPPRPPVVCIMGHVDHGKTTLMDCLRRKAQEASNKLSSTSVKKRKKKKGSKKKEEFVNVAGSEAGGITQVVSAFQVQLPGSDINGTDHATVGGVDAVTFLDTPGHAAFKAMRQSGSNGADVIVLVIAADDGVSPQTKEILDMYKSIARAQQGSISLMVAMTKIDKPGIDVDSAIVRIEGQLMEEGIYTERMTVEGCEFDPVQLVPLSGLTGEGVDELIELLALQSEIMDLRADSEARAEGLVIDAKVRSAS